MSPRQWEQVFRATARKMFYRRGRVARLLFAMLVDLADECEVFVKAEDGVTYRWKP